MTVWMAEGTGRAGTGWEAAWEAGFGGWGDVVFTGAIIGKRGIPVGGTSGWGRRPVARFWITGDSLGEGLVPRKAASGWASDYGGRLRVRRHGEREAPAAHALSLFLTSTTCVVAGKNRRL